MRKELLVLGWLGFVTTPYIVRKLRENKGSFTGSIATLHSTGNDEIGYYVFPGIMYPPEKIIKGFINPERYDLHLVHYGHRGYEPELAAEAAARHIKGFGYKKVRIISFSMGDQLLRTLGKCLPEYVKEEGRLEIVSIDSLPNPDFIGGGCKAILVATSPLLMALRILGGIALEIPCFRRDECWRSPAEVLEQLSTLLRWDYDYTDSPIMDCVKAIIKDGYVFYDPRNAGDLFRETFYCTEEEHLVFFNVGGDLANIRDSATVKGYYKVFNYLNWKF